MLSERLLAYLSYFESLASQPPNRWDGFYMTQQENKNYALRYQIAFPCYALGAISLHPDADQHERERCLGAMALLIDRMMQRRVWAYWAIQSELDARSTDPIRKANVHYSGHLAMMIGLFEVAGGDNRYDDPFRLLWTGSERFEYTHTSLMDALHQQMSENHHHGVNSEVDRLHLSHMNQVVWANVLYDTVHEGGTYSASNGAWLEFLKQRLVLRGPRMPGRGVFSSTYMSRLKLSVNTSLNMTDAWTLAFLALLAPTMTRELAPRFMKCVRRQSVSSSEEHAMVPSAPQWRSAELSDETLTTGFGYILAVHLDEAPLAAAFLSYADAHFQPVESEDGTRCYTSGLSVPFTTALFALGEAGGFHEVQRIGAGQRTPEPVEIDVLPANRVEYDVHHFPDSDEDMEWQEHGQGEGESEEGGGEEMAGDATQESERVYNTPQQSVTVQGAYEPSAHSKEQ